MQLYKKYVTIEKLEIKEYEAAKDVRWIWEDNKMDLIIGIILIAAAIFLIVAVLLQSGKDKGLSGAIGGSSSETYYGKNKGNTKDQILNKLTTVVAIVFAVLVLLSFVIQDDAKMKYEYEDFLAGVTTKESESTSEKTTSEVESTDAE